MSSSIKILHDVIIYNALTAISSIHVDDIVVNSTASIPDVTTLKNASGDWSSTYSTVNQNSAHWDAVYSVTSTNSANWSSVYTNVGSNSAKWDNSYIVIAANSAQWDDTYINVSSNSARWNDAYTIIETNSADWNNTHTAVSVNSADWNTAYAYATTYAQNSASPTFTTLTVASSLSVHGDLLVDGVMLSGGRDLTDIFEVKGHGLRYTSDIVGDGISKSFTFNHNLSTSDLVVGITDKTTSEVIYTYVAVTSTAIDVEFSNAFVGAQYRLVAFGNIPTSVVCDAPSVSGAVASVAGRTGNVALSSSDITTNVSLLTASRVLSLDDVGSIVQIDSTSSTTVTVPANSSVPIPVGTQIVIVQKNVGQITITGDSGVAVVSNGSKNKTSARYSFASLIKLDVDEWLLGGDITT